MARIRSIHPNQWTDEAFVSVSPYARLLAIGLRNEADDGGVFAWKPLTLKMRLLPADNVDIPQLLQELVEADIIRPYQVGSQNYGAIRNFLQFNRPKAPHETHPRLPWVPNYCGDRAAKQSDLEPPKHETVREQPAETGKPNGQMVNGFHVERENPSETMGNDFRNVSEISSLTETYTDTESEGGSGGIDETVETVPVPPDNTSEPELGLPAEPEEPADEPEPELGPEDEVIVPPPRKSKRVRRLDDLVLDEELLALAAEEKRDAPRELNRFKDFCRAKDRRYKDYRAGFRNWLRSDFGQPSRASPFRPNAEAPKSNPGSSYYDDWN